jgi:CspA family cold shock protein
MDLSSLTTGAKMYSCTSAVKQAGFTGLSDGAKVSYEIVNDRGKEPAANLRIG